MVCLFLFRTLAATCSLEVPLQVIQERHDFIRLCGFKYQFLYLFGAVSRQQSTSCLVSSQQAAFVQAAPAAAA